MPAFLKSPKFIVSAIVVLWVAYILWANIETSVVIYIFPHFLHFSIELTAIIIGSMIFGALVALIVQFMWKRRSSSKNASSPGAPSKSTVA